MLAVLGGVETGLLAARGGAQEYNHFQRRRKFHISLVVLKQTSLNSHGYSSVTSDINLLTCSLWLKSNRGMC